MILAVQHQRDGACQQNGIGKCVISQIPPVAGPEQQHRQKQRRVGRGKKADGMQTAHAQHKPEPIGKALGACQQGEQSQAKGAHDHGEEPNPQFPRNPSAQRNQRHHAGGVLRITPLDP